MLAVSVKILDKWIYSGGRDLSIYAGSSLFAIAQQWAPSEEQIMHTAFVKILLKCACKAQGAL